MKQFVLYILYFILWMMYGNYSCAASGINENKKEYQKVNTASAKNRHQYKVLTAAKHVVPQNMNIVSVFIAIEVLVSVLIFTGLLIDFRKNKRIKNSGEKPLLHWQHSPLV